MAAMLIEAQTQQLSCCGGGDALTPEARMDCVCDFCGARTAQPQLCATDYLAFQSSVPADRRRVGRSAPPAIDAIRASATPVHVTRGATPSAPSCPVAARIARLWSAWRGSAVGPGL